ncbi:MAG: Xaa-Pro dipeptidase [Pseudomonadota bacterium]
MSIERPTQIVQLRDTYAQWGCTAPIAIAKIPRSWSFFTEFHIPNQTTISSEQLQHLEHVERLWATALEQNKFDGAWLMAGDEQFHFQDDQGTRFKPPAYFSQWVDPEYITPGSRMYIAPGAKPVLFLSQPEDYWHAPAPFPEHLANQLEIRSYTSADDLEAESKAHQPNLKAIATIGPSDERPGDNLADPNTNPEALLNYLNFHRAAKTEYELVAMREASRIAVRGHKAAETTFFDGGSEFDIHMAYLRASAQNETDLPYGNIVALNEHGATLHYQHQVRTAPEPSLSLLIDAGGQARGYASDITRTYAAAGPEHDTFVALIDAMQVHQDKILDSVKPGVTFAALHVQMHEQLARLLIDQQLVTCGTEEAINQGITRAFCPHGLGHLLGLQVHDVGGHIADAQGSPAPPPAMDATLRFTRALEENYVFTIEPGLYFISFFLKRLRQEGAAVNWNKVDPLIPYGGIRIEDNLRITDQGLENLTRDAFDDAE